MNEYGIKKSKYSFKSKTLEKDKVWNLNFILLLQGSFVSVYGDILYEMALGFWILTVTGSTGIMGGVMAVSTIPRAVISPLAGVIVDRYDKRKIMLIMDLIRAVIIIILSLIAMLGMLEIWMVFATGVILGVCGAFYGPAASSILPDLVPNNRIVEANSSFNASKVISKVIANPTGGVLYQILSIPILFLINGLSFLVSGISLVFMKFPKKSKKISDATPNNREGNIKFLIKDLTYGLKYIWEIKGLRNILISASLINFFASIIFVLVLPYFQRNKDLGATKYGIAISAVAIGMIIGMLILSVVKIESKNRFKVFFTASMTFPIVYMAAFISPYLVMIPLLVFGGIFQSFINIIFESVLQLTVAENMRGKVFAILDTATISLTPIAMAVGGIIAEFISIKIILMASSFFVGIGLLPCIIPKASRRYINTDTN